MKYTQINKLPICINDRCINISGHYFTVISFVGKDKWNKNIWKILFDSGYEVDTDQSKIVIGNVKDRLSPSVCGVGILGYYRGTNTKARSIWGSMISRCCDINDNNYKYYGAKGVTVCTRWLRFDYFLEDLPFINGYDEYLFNNGLLELDKDMKQIKLPYNMRIYSKETCTFLSRSDNIAYQSLPYYTIPVYILDIYGNIIFYNSIEQCERELGICYNTIIKYRGTGQYYKGYNFLYKPYTRIT